MKFSVLCLFAVLLAAGATLALLAPSRGSVADRASFDRRAVEADFQRSRLTCELLHGPDLADIYKMRRCVSRRTSSGLDTRPALQAD